MTRRAARQKLSLPQVEDVSTRLRTIFINVGFFAGFLLLIPSVAGQFVRSQVVIEPVAVPSALVERGFTPEVVANRLWDGLQQFAREAVTARRTVVTIPDSQLVEFSLPDSAISIDSLFQQVRQFFNIRETRIGGEIVCATDACDLSGVTLRLRITGNNARIIDLPVMGELTEAEYYRLAAAGVYDVLDPFVSIAALATAQPLQATARAEQLILAGNADAKWAHNLIGDIARAGGDFAKAAEQYRAALALDDAFALARTNLGFALVGLGELDAARAEFTTAGERDPASVAAALGLATIAERQGDTTAQVAHLLEAASRDALVPDHLVAAARIELAGGQTQSAEGHLVEALAIDPGDPDALDTLGTHYLRNGRLADAEKIYRDWVDYEPSRPEPRFHLGNVHAAQRRFGEALRDYESALSLGDKTARTRTALAGILTGLGRYEDALGALDELGANFPADPSVELFYARTLVGLGRDGEALPAFRAFLDTAAPDNEQRQFAADEIARIEAELTPPPLPLAATGTGG